MLSGTSGIVSPAEMVDSSAYRGSAKDSADYVLRRFQTARTKRATWDGHFQDIKELVRPDTLDFNRQMVPGYRRYDLVFDGTAIDANEELASGLHSYLTSPTERWFELGIKADGRNWEQYKKQMELDDPDGLAWLEMVSDIIYACYADHRSKSAPVLHEGYLDLGAFGSLVIEQEWSMNDGGHVMFQSFPLADCYYMENADGVVDTMFRYFTYTGRNILQEFGEEEVKAMGPKIYKAIMGTPDGIDREFRVIHGVYPRTDRDVTRYDKKNKRFASCYVVESTRECVCDDGFDAFPYHVSRWLKIAGEVYGRGPAMKCLPDIKSLNAMEKTLLKAAQKAIDPPLVVPDDGFLLPIKTAPGSIIFKEPNAEKIEVLEFKGNVQLGIEYPNQKREYIRKCFHADWLKMMKDNKEMTATEVMDRRDEKLRMMAPMLGRQQTELLGPMIARTYQLLRSHGRIPPAPQSIHQKTLEVSYVSPAARAQQGVKGQAMQQYVQDLVPLVQVDPSVIDAIDMDKLAQQYAVIRGVPRIILRSKKDMAQKRADREKQQQMQQMAQVAEPASKAMLNISQAQKGGQ